MQLFNQALELNFDKLHFNLFKKMVNLLLVCYSDKKMDHWIKKNLLIRKIVLQNSN